MSSRYVKNMIITEYDISEVILTKLDVIYYNFNKNLFFKCGICLCDLNMEY